MKIKGIIILFLVLSTGLQAHIWSASASLRNDENTLVIQMEAWTAQHLAAQHPVAQYPAAETGGRALKKPSAAADGSQTNK